MRICGFHIDGFGIFHDQGIQDIPNGLVLFTGRNESGKTTLMEFARMVLFGFPNRKGRNDYQPLRGGTHGGRLKVMMQDGRLFIVERLGKHSTVTEEDRITEQVEPSERLLGGIDRQTFEHIFAIGLNELEGLDVLSQEDVRGRLLAASTGVGAASVPGTMKKIDEELDSLLKSGRATKPQINMIVRRLEDVNSVIRDIQGQAANYAELRRKQTQLEEQIDQSRGEVDSIRQRLERINQLMRAREPWGRLCEARKRVKELEYARGFPPNGLERFEKLNKEIEDCLGRKKTQEREAELLKTRLSEITVDETLIKHQEMIDTLKSEREKLVSALKDYPIVKSETQQKEKDFLRRLRDLGTDWDSRRLIEVDTSIQTRQRIQEFDRQLDLARREQERVYERQRGKQDAEREAKRITEEMLRLWDALPTPSIIDSEELERQRNAMRRMRSLLHRRDNIAAQLSGKREMQQEVEERLVSMRRHMEERAGQLPSWAWVLACIAGVLLAAVSSIFGSYIVGVIMFLAGIVSAVFIRKFCQRQVKAEVARRKQIQDDMQKTEKKERELDEGIEALQTQLLAIAEERDRIAHGIDIERPNDSRELDGLESALEGSAGQLREWMERKQRRDEAEENWQNAQVQLKQTTKEAEDADKKLQRLEGNWQKWIAGRGFAETIRPEEFEVILQMVENARTAESSLQESRDRVGQMKIYISEVRDKINYALNTCGMESSGTEDSATDLDALGRALGVALSNQQRRNELKQKLEIACGELAQLGEEIYTKQTELDDLTQKAGATDEEKFRRIAKSYEEWHEYIQRVETSNLALLTIAGTLEAQETLEAELEKTESLKLQLEQDDLKEKWDKLTNQVSADEREIGGIKEKLTQMAQDKRLSELLLEQRNLQAGITNAARRWATLVISRHLLNQARGIYERERQPKVIQEATRFVNTMTNMPYRLVMPAGSEDIQLEDSMTLHRKDEIGWSSGLADQVYLAIRFGLAHEFAEHAEPLPLILDDVLVRFDPERQLGTAKVILDLARDYQVLMFTCHPEIRGIIENALEDCHFRYEVVFTCYAVDRGQIMRE